MRDQYAILITLILFWIFGYWGLAGIIMSAIKARRVYNALTSVRSGEKLEEIIHSQDAKDVAIDLISRENRIPKLIATKIYDAGIKKLSEIKGRPNETKFEPNTG